MSTQQTLVSVGIACINYLNYILNVFALMSVFTIKTLKKALISIENGDKKSEKAMRNVSKYLSLLQDMLNGTENAEPLLDMALSKLAQDVYHANLLLLFINNLAKVDFECRKNVTKIFSALMARQIGTRSPTAEYVCTEPRILFKLIKGYENYEIAMNCGAMLRECARHEPLAKIMLHSDDYYKFFDYCQSFNFDIAVDSFTSFKAILTEHSKLSASFLGNNHKFFAYYKTLLESDNYVTKRLSFKLLGQLIAENFSSTSHFISHADNLRLVMTALNDASSGRIQFEAFHVFKLIAANPDLSLGVRHILLQNRGKLIRFLSNFQNIRSNGDSFACEKAYLIELISKLKLESVVN